MYNSILKFFISALAGVLSIILLKSNFIGNILNNEVNNYTYFSIAILSGFSEHLIPNLLNKIDENFKSKKEGDN